MAKKHSYAENLHVNESKSCSYIIHLTANSESSVPMVRDPTNQFFISDSDLRFQQEILSGVARTFALTTPQLPRELRALFGNAYLLCRINDTIEDNASLTVEQKDYFARRYVEIVTDEVEDDNFSQDLIELVSESVTKSEKELIAQADRVVGIKRQFSREQQMIVERCVSTMSRGMIEFQRSASIDGLSDLAEFNRYCYSVAGIVGVTLTELMCDYSDEIRARREELLRLGVSFGQGLQMVNILKDCWEDRARGVCWLPRSVFLELGVELRDLGANDVQQDSAFAEGLSQLVAFTNFHLTNAQRYIELIPSKETGYRRYCLWAAGMGFATLRRIEANPHFRSGQEVKISKTAARSIIAVTSIFSRSDRILGFIFNHLRRGLPTLASKDKAELFNQQIPDYQVYR